MTIINKSMFPVQAGYNAIAKMQSQMTELQLQLGTQQKASTLAGMGDARSLSLSLRSRMSTIEGYNSSIEKVNLRLDFLDKAVSRLDALEGEARNSATPGAYGSSNVNLTTVTTLSRTRLDEVVTLLNTEVNGRYLFAGNDSGKPPVADATSILDGNGTRAGFRQVAMERKLADAGADGRGRVTVAAAADTVTIAEDGVHPFGIKLSTLSTTSSAVSLTQLSGSPGSLGVQFTGVPIDGQTITMDVTMPDGSAETMVFKAVTTATGAANEFVIGPDADTTAANFATTMQNSLYSFGQTKLAAASVYAAAGNFFNGQGQTQMRVDGPPFETATGLVAGTAANTVQWYTGQDSTGPARQTVSAKIDDATTVNYGVQANESGLAALVGSLAAMSIETFPASDPSSKGRFDAMAKRNIEALSESHNAEPGSIEVIGVELGMARVTAGNTKARHDTYLGQLTSLLSNNETVNLEEVAMQILALKTRLEASYATTSMVSQLSLVNYLR